MTELGQFYCVMDYTTRQVLYRGDRLHRAAQALEPGTCYGTGWSAKEAHEAAQAQVNRFKGTPDEHHETTEGHPDN